MYGNTPLDELQTAERERRAVEMANDGLTFDEIAAELGYTHRSAAYKAYRRAIRRVPKAAVEEMRLQDIALLAHYRRALAPNVAAHEARAVEVLLKAMEHRAKLYGLYQEPTATSAAPIVIYEYQPGFMAAVRGELAPVLASPSE